jgi:DNA-binding MarR family transcriptional regulator
VSHNPSAQEFLLTGILALCIIAWRNNVKGRMKRSDKLSEQVALVRAASRQIVRELGYLESKNALVDVSMPQLHALIEIDKAETLTAAELAKILKLNQSSTCRTIAQLKAQNWVETVVPLNDNKRKPVRLTKLGKKKLAQINQVCGSLNQMALRVLTATQLATLIEGVTLYAEALSHARLTYEQQEGIEDNPCNAGDER